MDTGFFIALINPGISLIFAAAFFLLWQHQRRRFILLMCLSYLAVGVGFLLQYFTVIDITASRVVSNLAFLAAGFGIVVGSLGRYDRPAPLALLALIIGGGFILFLWFMLVRPDIIGRIYAINYAFGTIMLLATYELARVPARKLIDNVLLGVMGFWGATYFIRPLAALQADTPMTGYEIYHQTIYWITLTFSSSFFLLLYALTMITSITLALMDELKRESQTDALSRLLNRRGFEEQSRSEVRIAQRRGMPMALIVCDLDHFKSINDTYGHAVGDAVIRSFADRLRNGLGPGPIVGRVGGEEFSILLRGANASTARLLAEGIRTSFSMLPMADLPEDLRTSASFGVAEWVDGESVEQFFIRADEALYEAKKAGRDCVRVSVAFGQQGEVAADQ